MDSLVEVRQEDRDAAAEMWLAARGEGSPADWQAEWMKGGTSDIGPVVQAFASHRQKAAADARKVSVDLAASLAAAISLLEKGGKAAKKAAPSDKMFDQMLRDYKASLNRARAALTALCQDDAP